MNEKEQVNVVFDAVSKLMTELTWEETSDTGSMETSFSPKLKIMVTLFMKKMLEFDPSNPIDVLTRLVSSGDEQQEGVVHWIMGFGAGLNLGMKKNPETWADDFVYQYCEKLGVDFDETFDFMKNNSPEVSE